MLKRNRQQGFTLIELMIVVAIIGIIAAIAYPSYQRNIENTRRTTAQADMMELAQALERRFTANYTYMDGDDEPALRFDYSPRDQSAAQAFYNFGFESVDRNSYTLRAVPDNAQENERCGTLTLDHQGNRGADGDNCW